VRLEQTMGLNAQAIVIQYVENIERATSFYRDTLGLPLGFSAPGWVQFDAGGSAILLHTLTTSEHGANSPPGDTRLGFQVNGLEGIFERLTANGIRFVAPPSDTPFGRHATVLDSEGNEIELLELDLAAKASVTGETIVNNVIAKHPETMEVFENHGIRICGGCLVLLNAPVYETAEYSGLDPKESSELIQELNDKMADLG
jgi:lactoylglutathione lyase